MNRTLILTVTVTVACLFGVNIAHSASLGDMFGGKKAKEYEARIEEKDQECQAKLEQKDYQYQQLIEGSKDSKDDLQSFRDKNATLMEAYERLKKDQDRMMDQSKRLRRDNQRYKVIKESFDQLTEESKTFLDEKEALGKEARRLSVILEHLKAHVKAVTSEKDQLAFFLAEAQESESVKIRRIKEKLEGEYRGLQGDANLLEKENSIMVKQLKEIQKELNIAKAGNKEFQQELALAKEKMSNFQKSYDEMKSENRYLAQEAVQFPKRFADLARHNRKLVKETAHMHYNLGVSHIKSKEYKRAVKEFEKVLELKPNDAYANYNLGYIYAEHLVDRPAAIGYFQDYLTYAKDAKDADWVRKYVLTWQTWYGKERMK